MYPQKLLKVIATSVPEEAGGGIVALHRMLSEGKASFKFILLPVASSKPYEENVLHRITRLVKKYIEFCRKLYNDKTIQIVHINTAPDQMALMRDVVFIALSILFKRKVVLQIHGGYSDYKRTQVVNYIVKAAILQCNLILIFSEREMELINTYVGKNAKMSIITNAVKVSDFCKQKRLTRINVPDYGDNKVILFLARFVTGKGVYELIAAIPLIIREYRNVIFIFAGDGPEKVRMQEACKLAGIEEHVRFPGYLSYDRVVSTFINSDIFVLPSHSEAMPMTILQALAAGVPIVATYVGAVPEIIKEGINGFLIQPRNIQQLTSRILCLLRNDTLRRQIGDANIGLAKKEYDLEILLHKMSQIYSEV